MAGKKVKGEVEGIRAELQHLSEAVWALREHVTIQTAAAAAASPVQPRITALKAFEPGGDGRGTVVLRGVMHDAAGRREYRWDAESTVDELLATDDDRAARLLAAIGHRQRLAILKLVLDTPTTAAGLVTALELGTTGAAYHHLNVLQAADLVIQEGRGLFAVRPERVAAIFAMLAGIETAAALTTAPGAETESAAQTGYDGTGKRKKKRDG